MAICIILYAMAVNFFRCPIRIFNGDKEGTVLAAADGKVVVIEEVEENEYFHDRRLMIPYLCLSPMCMPTGSLLRDL